MDCLKKAVEYVQLTQELELCFMASARKMKKAFNLCSSSERFTDEDIEKVHFYQAVRSILFKMTKGEAPDTTQMNCEYISSDIPFNNDPSEQRTDILFLDKPVALSDQDNSGKEYESIVIIELKRPMRDDYKPGENPIDGIL